MAAPSTTIQTVGGALFEEFFQSIVDQEQVELDESQRHALTEYIKGAVEKRDRLGDFIVRMEAEADAIRNEEKRLAARRSGFEKIANCMRDSIHAQMREWDIKKVEGARFTFAVQKNPASVEVTNEAEIPGEFLDWKPQVDKVKVKEALASGQEVPGARLVTDRTRMVIR